MTRATVDDTRLFCTFRLSERLFAVAASDVKEISTETRTTAIAHSPSEVLGLINIRGHIHLVLDLRCLLGMPPCALTPDSRLILFKPSIGSAFGVVVDSISSIVSIDSTQIEAYAAVGQEPSRSILNRLELVSAICKQADELIVLLNPGLFLTAIEKSFEITPH